MKGGQYWFFNHSPWHGLTVADLVMPWFMFMMGVSFTFSIKSMTKKKFTERQITEKIVTRSFKLFMLGLFIINSASSFDSIRIMGVLQRFGIGYLVGLYLIFKIKGRPVFQWVFCTIIFGQRNQEMGCLMISRYQSNFSSFSMTSF